MTSLGLAQAETLGNELLPRLDALRESSPIYWSAEDRRWIVTGHAQVAAGFRGEVPLSARRTVLFERVVPDKADRDREIPYLMHILPHWVTNNDMPDQFRLRKLMARAFNKNVAEAYRPEAIRLIEARLAHAEQCGTVEFMEEIARPIPAGLILKMMGLGGEYLPALKRWAYYLNAGIGGALPTIEILRETEACLKEMRDIFIEAFRARERNPGEDFLSQLLLARDGKDRLTEDELVAICHLTLIAGHDTTANSLALGTALLEHDSAARDHLRAATPNAIDESIFELMRLSGVSTSMTRIASEDFEWEGNHIRAGQIVTLVIVAANRDPKVFPNPLAIDFDRSQRPNMTFAPGLHHCIGHFMARMQLGEFFPRMLARFDRVEVLDPAIQFGAGISFRGPEHMNVRFAPRKS